MKNLIVLLLLVISADHATAQTIPTHDWHLKVLVVDEAAQPVPGATAHVGFFTLSPPPKYESTPMLIDGLTDTNGIFTASHASEFCTLHLAISKMGYYATHSKYAAEPQEYNFAKWNPSLTLVLKKMVHPIPMYAKKIDAGPPVYNKPIGYDLKAGDWVAPYGKGLASDIIFTGAMKEKAKNDFDYKLTVSFPNPADGIQEFTPSDDDKNSDLRSPYEAPTEGYQPNVVKNMSRHPGQDAFSDMNDPNRNYFIRVRTVLDEQGRIKSAVYGKIYGDFMQFTYYLNPDPNDRNVEFDPKQDLLKIGKSFERPNAP